MANAIKIFENEEFGSVRTMKINGEPYFVGKDVAEILGYSKARNAIANHIDDDDKKVAPIQGDLSYDFYLPTYNLLIEAQGQQHITPKELFGGEEQFQKQQEHDKRKRDYAEANGYKLLEIWYYDYDRIEEILNKELEVG